MLTLCSCVSGAGTAAKPTALERQLLGAYEELDDSLASVASVRAENAPAGRSFTQMEALAIDARATQRFNADDLAELKDAGCIAETRAAKVIARACSMASEGAVQRRLGRVVEEENRARRDIVTWAAYAFARRDGRPNPSAEEVEALRQAYRRLQYESARAGHVIEDEAGAFVRVK
ncbi:MAG: hypothetical protein RIT81_41665 [Deltaproteobacteria bacterium]